MKKLILLGCLLCVFASCDKKDDIIVVSSAQPMESELSALNYEKDFGNGNEVADFGKNPLTILESNDIIISSVEYDGTTDRLLISRINSSGTLLWQKKIAQGYKYVSGNCFETNSGELIALGASVSNLGWTHSKVYIAKLNPLTGDTIWTRTYGHNFIDRGIVGYEDTNANYWIVDFNAQNSQATLLKIAANGDSLTSIMDTEINNANYEDALITSDKKIVLVGEADVSTPYKTNVFICKYTDGVKDFSSMIGLTDYDGLSVSDVCETADGNYVVSGKCYNFNDQNYCYGFLLKVNSNGTKMWERILTHFNQSAISSVVEKQPDVFYLGEPTDSSGFGKLYKYDLTHLTLVSSVFLADTDIQLLVKNNTLYRASLYKKPGNYETVRVKAHTIY